MLLLIVDAILIALLVGHQVVMMTSSRAYGVEVDIWRPLPFLIFIVALGLAAAFALWVESYAAAIMMAGLALLLLGYAALFVLSGAGT